MKALGLSFGILLACAALAGCQPRGAGPHPGALGPVDATGPREALRRWIAAHGPGEEHRRLDPLVGRWNLTGWWWPADDPGASPVELSGIVDAQWTLGGRFIEARFQGSTLGIPYSGLQVLGFSALARRYQLVAVESTTTAMNILFGDYDDASQSITFSGTITDPAASGAYRGVLELGDGQHVFRGFVVGADGTESQVSEYVYRRCPSP